MRPDILGLLEDIHESLPVLNTEIEQMLREADDDAP